MDRHGAPKSNAKYSCAGHDRRRPGGVVHLGPDTVDGVEDDAITTIWLKCSGHGSLKGCCSAGGSGAGEGARRRRGPGLISTTGALVIPEGGTF